MFRTALVHRLEQMLNPRSVAIVGASEQNHFSNLALRSLRGLGFDGKLHVVNRSGKPAYGQTSATNCRAIGEPVDVAFFCVPLNGIFDTVGDALAAGIGNLVIVTSGFSEVGEEGKAREAQLRALCQAHGARVLGPNCLGYRNYLGRVALGSMPFLPQSVDGAIALVSASGSVAQSINAFGVQQGTGFTHVISTGNEMDVTAAELVDYLVEVPQVRAIALFLETVRDTSTFAAAAAKARSACKPIVALKVGSAPSTAAIATAHTSAVVGDDRVFDAACNRLDIVRVTTIEELVTTAATIAATGPLQRPGVAFISLSGGMTEIASDYGDRARVHMPAFCETTQAQLAGIVSAFGQVHNPFDLTGAAVRDESLWTTVPAIASRDPAIGLTILNWDIPAIAEPSMPNTHELVGASAKGIATPSLVMNNCARPINEHGLAYQQRHGLPFILPGVGLGLDAVAKLAWWSERIRQPLAAMTAVDVLSPDSKPRDERAALEHLAKYGVPVVPTTIARNVDEATAAARAFGGAVAMKILSPDIAHKSDVGGVALGLEGDAAIERAHRTMLTSVAAHVPQARIDGVLIAPMRQGGLEFLVGVARDPQWGPVLAIGLGGMWVEVLDDTALCLLPVDDDEIVRALRSLRAAKLLGGHRSVPRVNVERVAQVAGNIARAALALGRDLEAFEVNPLFIRGDQVEALDALATWTRS